MTAMDIKSYLREIDGLTTGTELRKKKRVYDDECRRGLHEIDRVVDGTVVKSRKGTLFVKETRFPLDHGHGDAVLGSALSLPASAISVAANSPELGEFDLGSAMYLDTETTGLAGGTGTYAFLIGFGMFEEGGFVVRQLFMRDYHEEEAMLHHFAEHVKNASAAVSFNGKTFDIPLLQTRFITARLRSKLADLPHFDLLHAVRRLWKERIGDCSLGNVEALVLGVAREGDVPSSQIPQLYFDYVRSRDARPLARVFYHNCQDVLSLVGLAQLACNAVSGYEDERDIDPADLYSLGKLYFKQKRFEESLFCAGRALEMSPARQVLRRCAYIRAYSLKRLHRWDEAESAWRLLLQDFPDEIVPRIELAKHYEHRTRDLDRARLLCDEIAGIVQTAASQDADRVVGSTKPELEHRLDRIRRKMARDDRM